MKARKKLPAYSFGVLAIVAVALLGNMNFERKNITALAAILELPREELRAHFSLLSAWAVVSSKGMGLILPIVAAIPSASYVYEEVAGRFYMGAEMRMGRRRCACSHFRYAALSGGAVAAAGLFSYALLAACVFPVGVETDGMALSESLQEVAAGYILPDVLYFTLYGMAMSALASLLVFLCAKLYFSLSVLFILAHMIGEWGPAMQGEMWAAAAMLAAVAAAFWPVWGRKSRRMQGGGLDALPVASLPHMRVWKRRAAPGIGGRERKEREASRGREALLVAKSEYRKWLASPRMILFAIAFLPMYDNVVHPLLEMSDAMGSPLNVLEPCIGALNTWMGMLIFGIAYMALMSPFPTADGNMLFYVSRMGKRAWILGEMLFQAMAAVTYSLLIAAVMAVPAVGRSFFANGWSLVVTDYGRLYGGGEVGLTEVIPPNLYFQMSPFRAFLFSYGLFTLFLLFCGMAFVAGCMYQKRLQAFALLALQTAAGCILAFTPRKSAGMWLFPVNHAFLAVHYRRYYRKYEFSPWASFGILLVLTLLMAAAMYRKAKDVSMDMIGGEVLK